MQELTYTNKDGLTPADGTTNLDWTDRNGVSDDPFNYHKDGKEDGDGYQHGGYPEITGETSVYPDTSYITGEKVDFFDNGNVYQQPQVAPNHGILINDTYYETVEEGLAALAEITDPVTVKLLEDISLGDGSFVVSSDQHVSIELNGHKLASDKTGSNTYTVINSGYLEISGNGEVVGSKRCIGTFGESAITIINGGTYTGTNNAFDSSNGGTLEINNAKVVAQEFGVLVIDGSHLIVNGGTFNTIDNAVIGTNGTAGRGNNYITINGGTFNGHIVSEGYIACGIYLANDDHLTVNGGSFNIENGCGILVRSGEATVANGVIINVSGDITGKVGDSRIAVPCKPLVVDTLAHYPGGEPSLVNETGYEVYEIVELESIEITTAPTKVEYNEGDALDLSGMVVTGNYSGGITRVITDYTTEPADGAILTNETEVVVSYEDKSAIQGISVIPAAELVNIEITTAPTKVNYFEGDALDLSGMVVTAHYDDSSSRVLNKSEYTTNPADGAILTDETEVVVSYQDKSATQAISVEAVELESINITIAPTKINYFEGDALDLSGMVVNAIYSNGSTPVITDYVADPAEGTQLTTENTKVTISYRGKSAEQAISVEAVVLESINITKAPDKVDYFDGQSLDLTGMVVSAHYNNEHIEIVNDYTTVPAAGTQLTTEDVKFTVSYEGKSVEQAISVEAVALENIEVTTPPTKIVYEIGDALDLSGMVVTAHYNDGHDEVVNDYTTVPENGAQLTTDIYEVAITYQDKSTAQNIKVGASLTGIEVVLVDSLYNVGDPLRAPDHVLAEYEGGTKKEVFNYTVEPPVGTPVTIEMDEDSPIVTYVEGDESATAEMDIVVF